MTREQLLPADPLQFIRDCIKRGRILWTYHVNMRLEGRFIPRTSILGAVDTFEIVEAYPHDKYLPSYLVLGHAGADAFHMLIALDVEGDNVRIVTAYRPDPAEWEDNFRRRRRRQ